MNKNKRDTSIILLSLIALISLMAGAIVYFYATETTPPPITVADDDIDAPTGDDPAPDTQPKQQQYTQPITVSIADTNNVTASQPSGTLHKFRFTISGVVTDTKGKPVPKGYVTLSSKFNTMGTTSGRSTFVDEEGRYEITMGQEVIVRSNQHCSISVCPCP